MKKITLFKFNSLPIGLVLFVASFMTGNKVSAQLYCNNEIVFWSEDFGTGTTSASNANVMNLSYQALGLLSSSGTYRVVDYTDQNTNWHKVVDHTPGDVHGRMIVANAKSGDFYRRGVTRNLGYPAGFYAVSFFIMNVDGAGICGPNPLLPQIKIKAEYRDAANNWIELQNSPVTTAPVAETAVATWVQAGGVFTLPTTGAFLVKRIRFTLSDETLGGCGNDFAIDDLKLSTCPEGGPLPVHFLSIAAQKKGTGVNISWSTGSEADNEYFEVERSNDGGNTWALVNKTKGSGTSNTTKNYVAYDAKPVAGINYYRIKQVDIDGASKYSATVVYKLTIAQTDVSVLANPFSTNITVDFVSDRNQVVSSRLFDNTGKQVNAQKITVAKGISRKTIETANLSRGMYILQVTDENGHVLYSDKLIKQ